MAIRSQLTNPTNQKNSRQIFTAKWERPRALAGPLNLFAKAIGGTASAIMRRVWGRLFRYTAIMLQITPISQGERQDIPYHF